MQSLTSNPRFFPQVTSPGNITTTDWSDGVTLGNVVSTVKHIMGVNFALKELVVPHSWDTTELQLFSALTAILPFESDSTSLRWQKLARPFASMLEAARFSLQVQCTFLVFFYARVLPFMSNDEAKSIMTVDGSPVEYSWVIPNRTKPVAGEPTRQVRFAIEPFDPRDGKLLRGAGVLDYYNTPEGSLGIVHCDPQGMKWRRWSEGFLFPDDDGSSDEIPEGSRFFVGFDFVPSGTLSLKTYYLPASRPPSVSLSTRAVTVKDPFPIYVGDLDFSPLKVLVTQLDPAFPRLLDMMLDYFGSLQDKFKPRFQIIAMDCKDEKTNRLKIYFRVMEGISFADVRRTFTLDGRNESPELSKALERLEILWNLLFPTTSSSAQRDLEASNEPEDERNLDKDHAQHPVGGLLYYYELIPGKDTLFPKVYLPVRHYCKNDLQISQAVEAFYNDPHVNVEGPINGEQGEGWVTREVSKVFNHRPLTSKAGIHTYITFGVKKGGWELTSYFSPELLG